MRRWVGWLCMLPALASVTPIGSAAATTSFASATRSAIAVSPDYGPATWVPADPADYTVASRPHDFPVQMIIIHDIEGTTASAIARFQDPGAAASANYIVSDNGQITQMVAEKDIAWHAGNWDYNTRAIGIEHEGYASGPNWYTSTMYQASAHLAASICSRWGVPMDRNHIIGHYQVPDPDNPGLYGGTDHHSDPGPNWNWSYYMAYAQLYASQLPSPPRMMPDPVASLNSPTSATVTWLGAQTCHSPITGYTVTGQPGNLVMNLTGDARAATFSGLQAGVNYTFTVTATNPDGQDTLTAQWRCTAAQLVAAPSSPQPSGTTIQLSASSGGCPNPRYQFWTLAPGSSTWTVAQGYSTSATFSWSSTGKAAGTEYFGVWALDASSTGATCSIMGCNDAAASIPYTVTPVLCTSVSISAAPASPSATGSQITFTGSASGCPGPLFEFWMLAQGASSWQLVQPYSANATFRWNSTGAPPGTERFGVWARDASSAGTTCSSFGCNDAVAGIPYTVTTPSCASVTISAAPASPIAHGSGTQVTFTAVAAGCSNPNPLYEFWMLPAGSSTWILVRGYSTGATFQWNTNGAPAGTEHFGVWVRDAASPGVNNSSMGRYDALVGTTYTLT
jgi:N-acetylmuramoyl-L-alanine amidase